MSREIETARLRLRPITSADLNAIHHIWIDPDVRKYLWDDEVISIEQAASAIDTSEALFAENGYGLWVVCPRDEETIIGFYAATGSFTTRRNWSYFTGFERMRVGQSLRYGGSQEP